MPCSELDQHQSLIRFASDTATYSGHFCVVFNVFNVGGPIALLASSVQPPAWWGFFSLIPAEISHYCTLCPLSITLPLYISKISPVPLLALCSCKQQWDLHSSFLPKAEQTHFSQHLPVPQPYHVGLLSRGSDPFPGAAGALLSTMSYMCLATCPCSSCH